jgi:hypothetical protein
MKLTKSFGVIRRRVGVLTCLLVDKACSNEALAYVAAGPLEDLLTFHGPPPS